MHEKLNKLWLTAIARVHGARGVTPRDTDVRDIRSTQVSEIVEIQFTGGRMCKISVLDGKPPSDDDINWYKKGDPKLGRVLLSQDKERLEFIRGNTVEGHFNLLSGFYIIQTIAPTNMQRPGLLLLARQAAGWKDPSGRQLVASLRANSGAVSDPFSYVELIQS